MIHFKHNKIIADLKQLVDLLKKYHFESTNTLELYRIQNMISRYENLVQKSKTCLKYEFKDLTFHISGSQLKSRPTAKAISVTIDTGYELKENMCDTEDIFNQYNFELYIKGYPDSTNKSQYFFFCWHLDREPNTQGKYIHPYYHLHAGGNKLDKYDLGNLFMIGSPRIPHPPMDIFLGIHFVILNFLHAVEFAEQRKILSDHDYIFIMERAQKRILVPYFSTINGTKHTDFTTHSLFPLYV